MYSNNRDAYRQTFIIAWQKHLKKLPLDPMETQLVEIILKHPEYHSLLDDKTSDMQEFALEENPFFHMSLHLALHEQIRTNRPNGIVTIYQQLITQYGNAHDIEHLMMTCLAQLMWKAQQTGVMPDEQDYLERLKGL